MKKIERVETLKENNSNSNSNSGSNNNKNPSNEYEQSPYPKRKPNINSALSTQSFLFSSYSLSFFYPKPFLLIFHSLLFFLNKYQMFFINGISEKRREKTEKFLAFKYSYNFSNSRSKRSGASVCE